MERKKKYFRLKCVTHCIYLTLKDIGKIISVKKYIARAQLITKFIFNYYY